MIEKSTITRQQVELQNIYILDRLYGKNRRQKVTVMAQAYTYKAEWLLEQSLNQSGPPFSQLQSHIT